jgi:hypothetical protein
MCDMLYSVDEVSLYAKHIHIKTIHSQNPQHLSKLFKTVPLSLSYHNLSKQLYRI